MESSVENNPRRRWIPRTDGQNHCPGGWGPPASRVDPMVKRTGEMFVSATDDDERRAAVGERAQTLFLVGVHGLLVNSRSVDHLALALSRTRANQRWPSPQRPTNGPRHHAAHQDPTTVPSHRSPRLPSPSTRTTPSRPPRPRSSTPASTRPPPARTTSSLQTRSGPLAPVAAAAAVPSSTARSPCHRRRRRLAHRRQRRLRR